jgi:hypothetical protein
MKVVVWVKVGRLIYDIKVRKCPPNYITKESEYIIEVDDYTEEDIKEYFEKPQIWGRRHEDPEKEEYIRSNTSLMHNNT